MFRMTSLLTIFAVVLLLPSGCVPPEQTAPEPETLEMNATAPAEASVGQVVALTASTAGEGDFGPVSYRWFQIYGRLVDLEGSTSAQANFTAPSLKDDTEVRFRVDAESPGGKLASQEIRVVVKADPDFGLDDSTVPVDPELDPSPRVRLTTSMGDIVIELDRQAAPKTVANFLRYVEEGFYDGLIFHRVIADFVIQGGGFLPDLTEKKTRSAIRLETTGLKNLTGTIAMARTNDPDSATSQFYINLIDNASLDPRGENPGYAVFGIVVDGLDVVEEIGGVETRTEGSFQDVPREDIVIESIRRI